MQADVTVTEGIELALQTGWPIRNALLIRQNDAGDEEHSLTSIPCFMRPSELLGVREFGEDASRGLQ